MSERHEEADVVEKVRDGWAVRYPDLDLRPVDVIGRTVRIAALALARLDRDLASSGITRTEFDVLGALARSDTPLRASEVTSVTGISGASTTKNVERLVAMGLVERHRLERDGRVVLLSLTDEGRALVDEQFPRRIEAERRMLDGLDDAEIATLTELLRRVTRNVEGRG
ncbi:putative MarR family transcriptional regulator [Gordonia paraffinivorans NBRC 108238]|uniref:MarR family transcriptional regulator n=1 Tax=Gordonia paraffinivorans NBRC 108238 TaxID=1223543 RepID=A0ABQ0IL60_9ACTN|nr:MarR family transcriptional regulator [Gordonia paraffinivorans]GAC84108.1 putative MarR family transcriptional regulator [Gordonia paraffinivorans NBRC 108238]